MKIYVDGVNQPLTTISDTLTLSIVNAVTPALNGRGGSTNMSSDAMDEVRVSAKGVVLSPDWTMASYNNQNSPGTFATITTGLTNNGPLPVVNLSSASLSFGNQTVNTSSTTQSVTLTNAGPGALNISGINVTGTNPGDFLQSNTCPLSPSTLAVNAACTITVTFTPSASGARSAAMTITDNGTGNPQSVSLTGAGVAPAVNLSSASVSFGNQTVNTSSTTQSVTLTNAGPGALSISGINVTGTNPGDFSQSNICPLSPSTLAVNTACTITVTFTPSASGARSAAMTITDNGTGNPQSVSLTGAGVAPAVNLSSASVSFGNQIVNTTSAPQSVTLTNNGPGLLTISSIILTGNNPGDFAQSNTCPLSPATLAVNAACTIAVTFKPTLSGTRSAAVTITDNGTGTPQSVSLTGTGLTPPPTPWPNGYNYQATFTVAAGKVPSAQANFPMLISGTFADLATAANGGKVLNTCSQTVGNRNLTIPCDLIFTSDAAGTALLSWEFESYNASTGLVNLWVNVPSMSSGTVIYGWYGNAAVSTLQMSPAATWGSSFQAVYHLAEDPSGTAPQMNDSTANANHVTMNGGISSQQQAGEIGGSLNFSAATAWGALANPANFGFERSDSFSLSGWYKLGSNSSGTLLSKLDGSSNTGWALFQFVTSTTPRFALGIMGNGSTSNFAMAATGPVTMGVWHHVVVTYTGTSTVAGMKIYVDGVNQSLTTISDTLTLSIVNAVTPALNGRGGSTNMSSDAMDEVRVSAKGVVLSPDWTTASYNNQNSPGTFATVATGLTAP
jgi:hypothetical protein